jgi:hypothetical protein
MNQVETAEALWQAAQSVEMGVFIAPPHGSFLG